MTIAILVTNYKRPPSQSKALIIMGTQYAHAIP